MNAGPVLGGLAALAALVGLSAVVYRKRGAIAAAVGDRPSEHFTWAELTTTSQPLDNTPTDAHKARLTFGAVNVLERVRELNGGALRVTSGYRSLAINTAIGGSKTSDHMTGNAADVYDYDGGNSHEVLAARIWSAIREGLAIPVDQVIVERHTGHLHLGWGSRQRAANFAAGGWLQTSDGSTYTDWRPSAGQEVA